VRSNNSRMGMNVAPRTGGFMPSAQVRNCHYHPTRHGAICRTKRRRGIYLSTAPDPGG
jgi:hypothetical protein